MLKIIINNNKTLLLFGSLVLLSGCSTIDGFIGGGLNAPESVETIEPQELSIDGNMTPSSEPELIEPVKTFQTTEELMKEKDNALVEQGMRLATAEKELMASNEEKNILQQHRPHLKLQNQNYINYLKILHKGLNLVNLSHYFLELMLNQMIPVYFL